ncbi:hypothetical protein CC78DRAFT_531612 [Lojkania enalia]|uniref:Rhodopsin domain-containing protein n=1 Tax=Lojkania enalia TaxID=147567 RepID=A0A9P4KHH2_9PLEO|nr:hypothetical protein CC78DRAFT_531612 [Didymosphaeria enalia]
MMSLQVRQSDIFSSYRARVILGVVIAFLFSSFSSLVLRFTGKRIKRTNISPEDLVIVLAQVVVCALAVTIILQLVLGNAGHHSIYAPSKVAQALKLGIVVQALHAASLGLIEISLCLFYIRIFDFRYIHIFSWSMIAIVLAWVCGTMLYTMLACRPLAFSWDPTVQGGHCHSNKLLPYVLIGTLHAIADITLFLLPLPILWGMKVSLADRIALMCVFGAGIITIVIGILRVVCLTRVSFTDISYTGAYVLVWSMAEPAIGISVACAPLFRPIFHCVFEDGSSDSDIELQVPNLRLFEMQSESDSLTSFVDPNVHISRRIGRHGSYVATQYHETGNWSQVSFHERHNED